MLGYRPVRWGYCGVRPASRPRSGVPNLRAFLERQPKHRDWPGARARKRSCRSCPNPTTWPHRPTRTHTLPAVPPRATSSNPSGAPRRAVANTLNTKRCEHENTAQDRAFRSSSAALIHTDSNFLVFFSFLFSPEQLRNQGPRRVGTVPRNFMSGSSQLRNGLRGKKSIDVGKFRFSTT